LRIIRNILIWLLIKIRRQKKSKKQRGIDWGMRLDRSRSSITSRVEIIWLQKYMDNKIQKLDLIAHPWTKRREQWMLAVVQWIWKKLDSIRVSWKKSVLWKNKKDYLKFQTSLIQDNKKVMLEILQIKKVAWANTDMQFFLKTKVYF